MNEKDLPPLPKNSHLLCGLYYKRRSTGTQARGQWVPHPIFRVPFSFTLKGPRGYSKFPSPYKRHFYTKKYAILLSRYQPFIYLSLIGESIDSEIGKFVLENRKSIQDGVAAEKIIERFKPDTGLAPSYMYLSIFSQDIMKDFENRQKECNKIFYDYSDKGEYIEMVTYHDSREAVMAFDNKKHQNVGISLIP